MNDPNIGIPLLVTTAPIFDEKREACGAVHVAKDISVLKKAEKEILALSKFPAENPSPVLRIAKDGEILYSNKPGLELLANWNVKIGEKVPGRWHRLIKETFESAKTGLQEEEEEVKGKLFSVAISPILEGGYANLYARNVTELKRLQEEAAKIKEATILEAMIDGVIVLDMNGNIIQCNTALAKMHGFKTPEEMKGINISGLVAERDLQMAMNEVKNTFESGISINSECTGKHKTGKEFPALVNASILKDEKGNIVGSIGVVRDISELKKAYVDISELKKAQEETEQARAYSEGLISSMVDGLWATDSQGKTIDVNLATVKMLGYDKDYLLKRTPLDFMPKEDADKVAKDILKAATEIVSGENKFITKDKKIISIWYRASPLKDASGKTAGSFAILRDISERKQVEEKIEIFSRAVENAYDSFFLADMNGNITYANKSAIKIFDYSSEEMIKLTVFQLTANPEDSVKIVEEIKNKGKWSGEVISIRKNKEKFPVLMTNSIIKDAKGNPTGMMGTFRDITERKQMQEQILASEKLAAMGRLVADVAHEINNPLSIIMGGTQVLEERIKKQIPAIPDLKANTKMIEMVINATRRCKEIVAGLLTSTRPTRLNLGSTNINKIIKESLASTKDQVKRQKIKVVKTFAHRLPIIEADGQRLNQVFINMITNACDAMPEGGELRIATRLQTLEAGKGKATASHAGSVANPAVEIEISDTGEGIRKEDLPKLFDPFFTTKKDGKGVGLGLSIAYGIVKEHGGSISVTSEKGKGTTFIVSLPCRT